LNATKLKIKFLGSGSKFNIKNNNFHSNILFEITLENNTTKKILFDASPNIIEMLNYYDIDPLEIQAIIISHLHLSHYGGLEYLGKLKYFSTNCKKKPESKFDLIISKELKKPLWNSLKPTMKYINGKRLKLNYYFNLIEISPKQIFNISGIQFSFIKVPHIIDDKREIPAFGLIFSFNNKKILITGDTQFDYWRFLGFYETYDIIFHDCEFDNYTNSSHAQFTDLKNLFDNYKKKIYLYHYNKTLTNDLKQMVLQEGFKGIVERGEEFIF
jgi:ribonuclease BN (tRNA processing enzyme)